MLEWEGEHAGPILLNKEVSHQSPGLCSEPVLRRLLLPTWLLKIWGNALIRGWSPKNIGTAVQLYSQNRR